MSGERKAVGPVRKELQGFRVLHQSLEAERCNSLLSDDPTVSSPGSRVCRVYVVVSLESYSSLPSALSGLTHQNLEDLSQPGRLSPRAPLAALVRIRGPLTLFPTRPGGHIVLAPGSVCILMHTC